MTRDNNKGAPIKKATQLRKMAFEKDSNKLEKELSQC